MLLYSYIFALRKKCSISLTGVRKIINKLTVKKGAIFDYEEIVCKMECNVNLLRERTEEIITKLYDNVKEDELRIKYHDEVSGEDLLLFVKRGYSFSVMQMWILEGICKECDYDERMETNGTIKEWLEVEIE